MIDGWDLLKYNDDPEQTSHNDLKAWVRNQTQESSHPVTATTHPPNVLRSVLLACIFDISENLDEQIGLLIIEAEDYKIQVKQADYFETRTDEWEKMLPTDVDEMGPEECIALLRAAKDEIAFLVNEISRLECYISVEKQMRKFGFKERRTRLRPLERKWVSEELPDALVEEAQAARNDHRENDDQRILSGVDSGFDYFSPRSPADVEMS